MKWMMVMRPVALAHLETDVVLAEVSDMDSDEEVTDRQLGVFGLAPKLVGFVGVCVAAAADAAAAGNVALQQEQEQKMEYQS